VSLSIDKIPCVLIAGPEVLKGNVALRDVTGGRETNPMWVGNVGSSEFEGALAGSLRFADVRPQRTSRLNQKNSKWRIQCS